LSLGFFPDAVGDIDRDKQVLQRLEIFIEACPIDGFAIGDLAPQHLHPRECRDEAIVDMTGFDVVLSSVHEWRELITDVT
jgi:hypothetical protein